MDHFCYLCFDIVFVILSFQFPANLWSPAGKKADLLDLLYVMFSFVFVT